MTEKILTPQEPEWEAFTNSLVLHLNIFTDEDDTWQTRCCATFTLCRNIIKNRFPNIDIEGTIKYFKENGWYCDCEVFGESPSYRGEKSGLTEPQKNQEG